MTSTELSSADDETRLHEALADTRRRRALRVLNEANASLTLEDLAAEVAALGGPDAAADEEATERIRTSLYHGHVPKLEEIGLVEFDPSQRTVALSESAPPIEAWL